MWNVATILNGTLSFMTDESTTTGSMAASWTERRKLAKQSLEYNCKSANFRNMFPEFVQRRNMAQIKDETTVAPTDDSSKNSHPAVSSGDHGDKGEGNVTGWLQRAKLVLPSIIVLLAVGVMIFPYLCSYIR